MQTQTETSRSEIHRLVEQRQAIVARLEQLQREVKESVEALRASNTEIAGLLSRIEKETTNA